MAIDDKFDAIEKAYPEKEPYLPDELAVLAVRFVLPGIVTDALREVCKRLSLEAQKQRAIETLKLLVTEVKDLKSQSRQQGGTRWHERGYPTCGTPRRG